MASELLIFQCAIFLHFKEDPEERREGATGQVCDKSLGHYFSERSNPLSELENANSANQTGHSTKSWYSGANDDYCVRSQARTSR